MKSISKMTPPELAAYVQTHLRNRGIQVVLSGGGAVALYSDGRYVSKDLDMVNIYAAKHREIKAAMDELGFTEFGRYYTHSETNYFIDFVSGPLAVGDEPVIRIDEIDYSTGVLRVISPTDCVKDRLIAYYYWGDLQSLEQAELVASLKDVDHNEIERWSKAEGKNNEYQEIKDKLRGSEK
jgi:hypothetical protein